MSMYSLVLEIHIMVSGYFCSWGVQNLFHWALRSREDYESFPVVWEILNNWIFCYESSLRYFSIFKIIWSFEKHSSRRRNLEIVWYIFLNLIRVTRHTEPFCSQRSKRNLILQYTELQAWSYLNSQHWKLTGNLFREKMSVENTDTGKEALTQY